MKNVTWIDCHTHRYLPIGWPLRFKRELRARLRGHAGAIVHDAGLWLPSNRYAAELSVKLRVPRVVSPRGMLSNWALSHGGARKKIVWRLHQKRELERASLLHATAESEAAEFRQCGLHAPVAVVPNGVDIPARRTPSHSERSDERVALFLSRIHPKKGLLDLVNAWAAVRPPKWRLIIAGDDEGGHRAVVQRAAAELGIAGEVELVGPVRDCDKWGLYHQADLFVLPSYSENFGIVVAEALAAAVPVITTRATPWSELHEHRCGWWTDTGPEPLASALREATVASDEQRRAMGERGRDLVQSQYSWSSAAEKMVACYEWLLGRGPRPECVHTR